MKQLMLICAPVSSRSGYGAHARDIFHSLYDMNKFNIKVVDTVWGDTPRNALNENNEKDGIYTGEFKDNKFHGQGKYQWHDGEIYEGEFANSESNGCGTLTNPKGQKFSCKFKNSVRVSNLCR